MRSRFIGGILLIVGTSVGGGMLALPIANASVGFWQSSALLILSWLVMTLGALFILEVNLYLPAGSHMISMAHATLGKPGLVVAWLTNLVLLYTLLCSYISGGGDVLQGWIQHLPFEFSAWQSSLLFTLLFGMIVYSGIRQVDALNRALMFLKLFIYGLVVISLASHVNVTNLTSATTRPMTSSLMLIITSFGFAIIVPNLRDYFNDDIPRLRRVIWLGSLIPLACYLAWDAAVIGTLPNLASLLSADNPTTSLAMMVSNTVLNPNISILFKTFTSICMLTAFLGVSLCMISFLSDGLGLDKKGRQGFALFLITFLPPWLMVVYFPGMYITALSYAGYLCIILLLFLPAMMSLFARHRAPRQFIVAGGRVVQLGVMLASLLIIIVSFF